LTELANRIGPLPTTAPKTGPDKKPLLDWSPDAQAAAAARSDLERLARAARSAGSLGRGEWNRLADAARGLLALVGAVRAGVEAQTEEPRRAVTDRFVERLQLRSKVLEDLVTPLGSKETTNVQPATEAAHAEIDGYFATAEDGPARLARLGAPSLLAAERALGFAIENVSMYPAVTAGLASRETSQDEDSATNRALSQLARAIDGIGQAGLGTPHAKHGIATEERALEQKKELAKKTQEAAPKVATDARHERPAKWELRVEPTDREVRVEAIAKTLGIERISDVRDVLISGLRERHQFVVWWPVGVTFSSEVQQLISAGLIESRVIETK
jgi:hypothetical protein